MTLRSTITASMIGQALKKLMTEIIKSPDQRGIQSHYLLGNEWQSIEKITSDQKVSE